MAQNRYAFRQAHAMIWHGKIWRYLLLPIFFSILYLPILITICIGGATLVAKILSMVFSSFSTPGSWSWWLTTLFTGLIFAVIGILSYRSVILIAYSPFLDKISLKVETRLLGERIVLWPREDLCGV